MLWKIENTLEGCKYICSVNKPFSECTTEREIKFLHKTVAKSNV